jgi:prepilin-type N-terminal cleavage/methylation domain-containing protein
MQNNITSAHRFALRRVPGFTLLELLIVVAIIGLLSVISFKVYGGMINTAKKVKAAAQVQAIVAAADAYYDDFRVYPPDTGLYKSGDQAPNGISASDMKYVIHRYLGLELTDKLTGKKGGPYIRDMDDSNLKGSEVEIDGRSVKIYSDPWWKPGEDDNHAFELYCKHWKRDPKTRDVKISMPYDDSVIPEQQTLEVKAWSRGPDGKSSASAPFMPGIVAEEDKDNIMSWAKGR